MKLDKLLWSKTKVDILKYLLFKRQWISIRALESELDWSFPAIKKQVDMLNSANIIRVDKDNNKWSIYINEHIYELIKKVFIFALQEDIDTLFNKYDTVLEKYFLGKIFGNKIDVDLVVIYRLMGKDFLDKIKEDIIAMLREYFIDNVGVVFMASEDFQRRYRMSDKFVLSLITYCK